MIMEKIRILLAAAESAPLARVGDLGSIIGSLSSHLQEAGVDIRIILPLYRIIKNEKKAHLRHNSQLIVHGPDGDTKSNLFQAKKNGITFYFVENDHYYDRPWLYEYMEEDGSWSDFNDNLERFSFFSRAVLEAIQETGFTPHLIHCFSWHTALIPPYLKIFYKKTPPFRGIKTLFTIPNIAFQGLFPGDKFSQTGLPPYFFSTEFYEYYGMLNLLKGGILFSDQISTISEQYARDIQSEKYGLGLEGVIRDRVNDLTGIINGIDYDEWDPSRDRNTYGLKFSANKPHNKLEIKRKLLKEAGIPAHSQDLPLIILTSRLETQKGLGLIEEIKDSLKPLDVTMIICSEGARRYLDMFTRMADLKPKWLSVFSRGSDTKTLHKVIAGGDILLMPSEFEPGGFYQLLALRYGTIPLVHNTGGLADTVTDEYNGFSFNRYSPEALLETLERTLTAFNNKPLWEKIRRHAMHEDYSCGRTAREYIKLYTSLKSSPK